MKRIIAILLIAVMMLSLLAACSKDSTEDLIGTWTVCGGEGESGEQTYQAMEHFGASASFTFRADGTGTMTLSTRDDSRSTPITFSVENGKLTIVPKTDGGDGEAQVSDYRLQNGKLYLTSNDTTLIYSR